MKTGEKIRRVMIYIFAFVLTVGICVGFEVFKINALAEIRRSTALNTAQQKQIVELSRENEQLAVQIDALTAEIADLRKQLDSKQDKADRGGERMVKRTMHVTAYWAGSCDKPPGHPLYGITASGEKVRDGYIAAGPELAIGTQVYIPYFGKIFTVMDRGGAIDNGDIDVFMRTESEALRFGVKDLEVWIRK